MGIGDSLQAVIAVSGFAKALTEAVARAAEDKKTYVEKLESASRDDVFKYVLLINVAALEGYVAQTRIQAEESFRLSRVVAIVGFAILGVAVVLAIVLSAVGKTTLEAAYLTAISGILTQFIAGVFFYLYNRTLQQINRFHDKLISMQQTSMAFLAAGFVTDGVKGDDARIKMATAMVGRRDGTHESGVDA